MNNFLIKNSGDPIDDKDVANKSYVNTFVNSFVDKTNKIVTKLSSDVKRRF